MSEYEKRRLENAEKAREAADRLFPGERWEGVEDGIYLSARRAVGRKSNYKEELGNARILRDLGSTVYLVPESRRNAGRQYDAIVDGLPFEFKNVGGNANTLITHFLKSRYQAANVFINLENSRLTCRQAKSALYGARNSHKYPEGHGIGGGMIVLKVRDEVGLVYLDVDGLKAPG